MVAMCGLFFLGKAHGGSLETLTDELKLENPKHGFISARPAAKWDESLICGNGTIGLTVPGDALKDRIIFSHEELFLPLYPPTVAPDIGSRMDEVRKLMLKGDAAAASRIAVEQGEKAGIEKWVWPDPPVPACQLAIESLDGGEVKSYARKTDFEKAEVTVAYRTDAGVFRRTAFASRKDGVAVIRISSPTGNKLNYKIRLAQLPVQEGGWMKPDDFAKVSAAIDGGYLSYQTEFINKWDRSVNGFDFLARVIAPKGRLEVNDGWLQITGAKEILILEDVALSYAMPLNGAEGLKKKLDAIEPDYDRLLASHAAIHSEMFNRFCFNLGNNAPLLVTSEELQVSSSVENPNPDLLVQVLKACRYNLICASGKRPPTLQGLWSGTWTPMWSGDYTLNGNAPTAIACGLNANFHEATDAYLGMMTREKPNFEKNAKELYGIDGIYVPSRMSQRGDVYHYAEEYPHLYWFAGSSWTAHFYYDKWLYTCDEEFLKNEAIPFMLGAYDFLKEIVYKDEKGIYHFIPSYSAENNPIGMHPLAIDSTHDVAGMKQLLRNLITLVDEGYLPEAGRDEYVQILEHLPDYSVDENGEFNEWLWPGMKNHQSHRHASHLYPLFDGVDPEFDENPMLKDGAVLSLENRLSYRRGEKNGGVMAFGLALMGMASAHLGDAEHGFECLNWLTHSYWTPAFGSYHDPGEIFNVDISGGMPAVVAYMLLQSTKDEITLLPCLPKEWADGSVKGLRARGGFEVDLEWKDGKLMTATIRSLAGRPTSIVYGGKATPLKLKKGESKVLTF